MNYAYYIDKGQHRGAKRKQDSLETEKRARTETSEAPDTRRIPEERKTKPGFLKNLSRKQQIINRRIEK
jgi:hypothetical protein